MWDLDKHFWFWRRHTGSVILVLVFDFIINKVVSFRVYLVLVFLGFVPSLCTINLKTVEGICTPQDSQEFFFISSFNWFRRWDYRMIKSVWCSSWRYTKVINNVGVSDLSVTTCCNDAVHSPWAGGSSWWKQLLMHSHTNLLGRPDKISFGLIWIINTASLKIHTQCPLPLNCMKDNFPQVGLLYFTMFTATLSPQSRMLNSHLAGQIQPAESHHSACGAPHWLENLMEKEQWQLSLLPHPLLPNFQVPHQGQTFVTWPDLALVVPALPTGSGLCHPYLLCWIRPTGWIWHDPFSPQGEEVGTTALSLHTSMDQ